MPEFTTLCGLWYDRVLTVDDLFLPSLVQKQMMKKRIGTSYKPLGDVMTYSMGISMMLLNSIVLLDSMSRRVF
jgi:hypothetical protein